jgi:hypothetical protein
MMAQSWTCREINMDANQKTNETCGSIDLPATARPFKSWSLVLASFLFTAAAMEMSRLYVFVHWKILFRWDPNAPQPPQTVFSLLGHLRNLSTLFAFFALLWAVWSFRSCPRWASCLALAISIFVLLMSVLVQT